VTTPRGLLDEWDAERSANDAAIRSNALVKFSDALEIIAEALTAQETPPVQRDMIANLLIHTACRRVIEYARRSADDRNPSDAATESTWDEFCALFDLAGRLPAPYGREVKEMIASWRPSEQQVAYLAVRLFVEYYPSSLHALARLRALLHLVLPPDRVERAVSRLHALSEVPEIRETLLVDRVRELVTKRQREGVLTVEEEGELRAGVIKLAGT